MTMKGRQCKGNGSAVRGGGADRSFLFDSATDSTLKNGTVMEGQGIYISIERPQKLLCRTDDKSIRLLRTM